MRPFRVINNDGLNNHTYGRLVYVGGKARELPGHSSRILTCSRFGEIFTRSERLDKAFGMYTVYVVHMQEMISYTSDTHIRVVYIHAYINNHNLSYYYCIQRI